MWLATTPGAAAADANRASERTRIARCASRAHALALDANLLPEAVV